MKHRKRTLTQIVQVKIIDRKKLLNKEGFAKRQDSGVTNIKYLIF